jgi:ADP-heptose:LPS heptosyltransferase
MPCSNGQAVDLITRSGFQALGSLMPHVNFRSKPNGKIYNTLWCFDDRRKSAFYSLLSRAREKHLLINPGASIQWYHSKIFRTIQAPKLGRSHISEYYWKHTLENNHGSFRPPELAPPPKKWACPISSINYLHVNPTSGWKSKNWTAEKWAITINRLAQHGIGPVVMTSGTQDWQKEHCAAICRRLIEPIECIAGETTIKNYLWIIWNAKAVLTVEGSASHIAAAFKRRCLTLFGHTNAVCCTGKQPIPGQFTPATLSVLNLRDYSSSPMSRLLKLSLSSGTMTNFYPLLIGGFCQMRKVSPAGRQSRPA